MSIVFTTFIMWVLYQNNFCSKGLAIAYTIINGIGVIVVGVERYITNKEKERKEFFESINNKIREGKE